MNGAINFKDLIIPAPGDLQFSDLFNLEEIQRMQDLFSDAMGVASVITYPDGTPITKPSNFCRLCSDIIRKTEKGRAFCYQSDAVIGCHNPTGPVVQRCLSGGLWDAGASITVGGKHIANWLIGQVRNEASDQQQIIQYADEIGANRENFIAALNEVPYMSVEQFGKVSKMLFAFANELSEKAYNNFQFKMQIIEREKVVALLQEKEESLSFLLNSIGDAVIATDKNGRIVNMNPVAETLCGWKTTEATGLPLTDVFQIVNSETREVVDNPVLKVLKSGKIFGLANHTVLISKDRSEYHIADSAAPIINREGEVNGVVLVFSDVTEKHAAQELIRKSEEKFYSLYMNMSEGAALHELKYNDRGEPEDYLIIETNPAFERQLGISRDDVIGKTSREAYGIAEPPYLSTYSRVAMTGEPVIFETFFPPLEKYFAISVYSPFKGSFATVFEDISVRRKAEQALRESEQRYRLLIQTANEGIMVAQGTHMMFVNQMFIEFTGYAEEELLSRPFIEFIHQDDRELVVGNQQKRLRGESVGTRCQIRILKNDKSVDWFEMSGMKIEWEGQPASLNFVTDISERRRSEEEIKVQGCVLK